MIHSHPTKSWPYPDRLQVKLCWIIVLNVLFRGIRGKPWSYLFDLDRHSNHECGMTTWQRWGDHMWCVKRVTHIQQLFRHSSCTMITGPAHLPLATPRPRPRGKEGELMLGVSRGRAVGAVSGEWGCSKGVTWWAWVSPGKIMPARCENRNVRSKTERSISHRRHQILKCNLLIWHISAAVNYMNVWHSMMWYVKWSSWTFFFFLTITER